MAFSKTFMFCAAVGLAVNVLSAETTKPPAETIPARDGNIVISPINHATFALHWNDTVVYVDPVGGMERFKALGAPDLILVTDIHKDHLSPETLESLLKATPSAAIVTSPAAADQLPGSLKEKATALKNGEKKNVQGVEIEAIPAYNLTPDRLKFHSKGRGNGYVLTLGGKRVYISGDTEDIPEMRALKDIDVAFVCMNLPYTMTVEQAASAVREFKPKVVYPYHYRGSDVQKFKELVASEKSVEVRLKDWYAAQ